jgi:hypothetical protein
MPAVRCEETTMVKELSEDAAARDEQGTCRICQVKADEPHDRRKHDNFWAAEDATW